MITYNFCHTLLFRLGRIFDTQYQNTNYIHILIDIIWEMDGKGKLKWAWYSSLNLVLLPYGLYSNRSLFIAYSLVVY